jgi:hypothetical protein
MTYATSVNSTFPIKYHSDIPYLRKMARNLRMLSPGLWHSVALVRTNISGEHITYINRVKTISELGTMSAVTSNWLKDVCAWPQVYWKY